MILLNSKTILYKIQLSDSPLINIHQIFSPSIRGESPEQHTTTLLTIESSLVNDYFSSPGIRRFFPVLWILATN